MALEPWWSSRDPWAPLGPFYLSVVKMKDVLDKADALWYTLKVSQYARDYCRLMESKADHFSSEPPHHLWGKWAIIEAFKSGAFFALSGGKFTCLEECKEYYSLKETIEETQGSDLLRAYTIEEEVNNLDLEKAVKPFLRCIRDKIDERKWRIYPLWYGWALMEAYKNGALFAFSGSKFRSWHEYYHARNNYCKYLKLREKVEGIPPEHAILPVEVIGGIRLYG